MSGMGANDIASAFFKTLDRIILDHPDATSIITWSDSCVPKQKLHNSICYGRILDEDSPDYNEVLIIWILLCRVILARVTQSEQEQPIQSYTDEIIRFILL